uniref:Uncharacterized protein n=1 Tax=Brassica campestris TaxID=3711 RepID=A0A3P6DHZ2_BRACM|nr:unnamed protein product [Brassica rapa]
MSSSPPPLTAQVRRSHRAFRPHTTVSDQRPPELSCPATIRSLPRSCRRITAEEP